jgi:hypothetical protein
MNIEYVEYIRIRSNFFSGFVGGSFAYYSKHWIKSDLLEYLYEEYLTF